MADHDAPTYINRDTVLRTIKAKKERLQRELDEAMRKSDIAAKMIFELNNLESDIELIKPPSPPWPPAPPDLMYGRPVPPMTRDTSTNPPGYAAPAGFNPDGD